MSAEKQRKAYAASENRSVSVIRILDCQLPVTIIVFKFICVDWTNQTFSNRIEGNWMTEVQPGILKAEAHPEGVSGFLGQFKNRRI